MTWHVAVDRLSTVSARLLVWTDPSIGQRITGGLVVGPISQLGQTLKSRLPLVPIEPASASIDAAQQPGVQGWGVVVPEPSTWSPDSPTWYELKVDLQSAGESAPRVERRRVGLRLLAARTHAWAWGGRRWVLRGLVPPTSAAADERGAEYRQTGSTWVLQADQSELLNAASAWGIPVLGNLTHSRADWKSELDRLAEFPAVAAVIVGNLAQCAAARSLWPQLLVVVPWSAAATDGQRINDVGDDTPSDKVLPAAWLVAESDVAAAVGQSLSRPLMIVRSTLSTTHEESRAEVDRLQAAVARWGDFAGYLALPADRHTLG